VAVRKLREALDDDAEDPRYIETIPKRGYRFLVPQVRRIDADGKEASHLAPSLTLIGFHSDQSSTRSFHATRDARAAARYNHVSVGVEDFKRNVIRIAVPVDLDHTREPLYRRPGSGGTKKEGLGHRAIRVAGRVLPDTQAGSG
jgi:hypothetical protein